MVVIFCVITFYRSRIKENIEGFNELADFALSVLCLPHSNADCERVFSKVNDIKTKQRNRLITPTINGALLTKQCIKGGRHENKNCVNFIPTKRMLSSITSAILYPGTCPYNK